MPEYFSHDYDTREDEKIIDMMAEMGWAGYGLFWAIVELLYKNGGKMRTQYNHIAFALNSHPEQVQQLIENYGLFQVKKEFFYSKSINKRLSRRKEKSEVGRANAYKRWEKEHAKALQTESKPNAIKERKGKEIKRKEININSVPEFEEFKKYAYEKKPNIDTHVLKLKYEAWVINDWKDGNGNPIKNWKVKLLNTIPYLNETKAGESKGTNLSGDELPESYGVRSKTAITREQFKKEQEK